MQTGENTVNVRAVFEGGESIEKSFSFIPNCDDNDAEFIRPLDVSAKIYEKASSGRGAENLVEAEIRITGEYKTFCARCLEELLIPVDLCETYSVASNLQNEDEDGVLPAENFLLDLDEAADALFYMSIPSKSLCREDCKGICPECGKNLNFEKCTCSGKKIDPRLEVLKKLLDKTEN